MMETYASRVVDAAGELGAISGTSPKGRAVGRLGGGQRIRTCQGTEPLVMGGDIFALGLVQTDGAQVWCNICQVSCRHIYVD